MVPTSATVASAIRDAAWPPVVSAGVRFRYTGQQYLPQLSLYYYKARFYSASLGRFFTNGPS